jgi:hypothetical protein
VEALDYRPRNATTALTGIVLVWAVASLALPGAASWLAPDPLGARIGPLSVLAALASDRPTTIDARASEHSHLIPGLISAESMTRSALLRTIGDADFPTSLIATSRLAADVLRRGPPSSIAT